MIITIEGRYPVSKVKERETGSASTIRVSFVMMVKNGVMVQDDDGEE